MTNVKLHTNNTIRIVYLHLSFGHHLAVLIVPPRQVEQPEHVLVTIPGCFERCSDSADNFTHKNHKSYIHVSYIKTVKMKNDSLRVSKLFFKHVVFSCIILFQELLKYIWSLIVPIYVYIESTCHNNHFDIKHLYTFHLITLNCLFFQNETRIQKEFTICFSEICRGDRG